MEPGVNFSTTSMGLMNLSVASKVTFIEIAVLWVVVFEIDSGMLK